MTKQELFDKAVKGLKEQGFIQSMRGKQCAYRGYAGRKCLIGHLITDEEYHPAMETKNAFFICERYPRLAHLKPHSYFLKSLQEVHDNHPTPDAMVHGLRIFAADHNLDVSELEECPATE